MRRTAAALLLLLAVAGCAPSVDTWIADQAERLADKGVTFPPDQARNAIVNVVSACVMKQASPSFDRSAYINSTQMQADWISATDAGVMYDFATPEFCASVPDGPLGRQ